MTTALDLYDEALTSAEPIEYLAPTGARPLHVARWQSAYAPGDAGLLDRCTRATLDLGCGPGRLAAAVTARGVPALGVDVSAVAVALTRARGAAAIRRDLFRRLPGEGRWHRLLLADGNIGIGGDPLRLLRRCRDLLAPDGQLLVELEPPGSPSGTTTIRLRTATRTSTGFPWAFLAADALDAVAAAAGLRRREEWNEAGRWFAGVTHATTAGSGQ